MVTLCALTVTEAQVLSTKTGQLGLKLITVDVYPVNTAPKLNVTSGSVTIDEMLVRKCVAQVTKPRFFQSCFMQLLVINHT